MFYALLNEEQIQLIMNDANVKIAKKNYFHIIPAYSNERAYE